MDRLELLVDRVAAGGDGIGRDDDGRIVFVGGAIPGERVVVRIDDRQRDFARASVVEVIDASADRRTPPCPNVDRGCGGCGWQHIDPVRQRSLKVEMVHDSLRRLARIDRSEQPEIDIVVPAGAGDGFDQRTTLRLGIDQEGVARYRRARSADLAPAGGCLVAHPSVRDLIDGARWATAEELTVRSSLASGRRVALAAGAAVDPERFEVPDDVEVVIDPGRRSSANGRGRRARPADSPRGKNPRTLRRGVLEEVVAGHRYEVSIDSFFQAGPSIAAALIETVGDHLAAMRDSSRHLGGGAALVDLYGGVGLFGVAFAERFGLHPTIVESSRSAIADAHHNTAHLERASVVRSDVGRWRPPTSFDAIVADPARPGLARPGVATVVATGAPLVVLVSCDVASCARDVRLLADAGYVLRSATVVDAFPQTPHVEVVTSFLRP